MRLPLARHRGLGELKTVGVTKNTKMYYTASLADTSVWMVELERTSLFQQLRKLVRGERKMESAQVRCCVLEDDFCTVLQKSESERKCVRSYWCKSAPRKCWLNLKKKQKCNVWPDRQWCGGKSVSSYYFMNYTHINQINSPLHSCAPFKAQTRKQIMTLMELCIH